MNYELLKQKMDKFFSETSSQDLVSKFEELGYSFIESKYKYTPVHQYENVEVIDCRDCKNNSNWLSKLFKSNKNKKQNLDKFEVFLCKLAIC